MTYDYVVALCFDYFTTKLFTYISPKYNDIILTLKQFLHNAQMHAHTPRKEAMTLR